MFSCMLGIAAADVFGNFYYTDNGTTITIDGYVADMPGPLVIPSTIPVQEEPLVTKPVTAIASQAFFNFSATSISIPEGVLSIDFYAFYSCAVAETITLPETLESIGFGAFTNCFALKNIEIPASAATLGADLFISCTSLKSITVSAGNPNFSSVDGVLFNKDQKHLIAYPGGRGGGYAVPAGTTNIDTNAFQFCSEVTSVTIPSSISELGNGAFYICGKLSLLSFLGDAPILGSYALAGVAPGFVIHVTSSAAGYDVAPWDVYTKVIMGPPTPVTDWLLSFGYPTNTDLQSDHNGDGVSFLMACALNLNPNQNLSGSLPQPVFAENQMSLSFYAGTGGISYVVEASPDMLTWSTDDVTQSPPDGELISTASVAIPGQARYMRLKVINN